MRSPPRRVATWRRANEATGTKVYSHSAYVVNRRPHKYRASKERSQGPVIVGRAVEAVYSGNRIGRCVAIPKPCRSARYFAHPHVFGREVHRPT